MRFRVDTPTNLDELGRGIEEDIARAMSAAIRQGADALKSDWRQQIEAAKLGPKLASTIRSQIYPQSQNSIDAAAWVWTKAPKIIESYSRGASIVARNGSRFLAIPTDAAPRLAPGLDGQRRKLTPDSFERMTGLQLGFVPRGPRKPALLVVEGGRLNSRGKVRADRRKARGGGIYSPITRRTTIVVFLLVRQVRVARRLDLDALGSAASARHADLLSRNWS